MRPTKAEAPVTGTVRRGHQVEQVGATLNSVGTPTDSEIQLVVTPIARSAGRFSARIVDGRTVVASSRTPFFAAARALLAEGAHPARMLVMKHSNAGKDSLRATIGTAAQLTVDECNGTLFATWKPFLLSAGSPPIARKASALTGTAGAATNAMGEAMAETNALGAASNSAESVTQAAIEVTTLAFPLPTTTTTAPSITTGGPKAEMTTIAMAVTGQSEDAEGGGHGR